MDATTRPKDNPWLLIQFSVSIRDSIYSIVRYNDTIGWEYNAYPGLQTYLLVGKTLFQALIIHKSHSHRAVKSALDIIMNSCIVSMYPHYNDHEYRNVDIEKVCANLKWESFEELRAQIAKELKRADEPTI